MTFVIIREAFPICCTHTSPRWPQHTQLHPLQHFPPRYGESCDSSFRFTFMTSPTATFYWHCDTKCAVFPQKATIISSVTPLFLSLSLSIYIWMHIGLDILFLWIYDAQPPHIGSLGWKGTNIWKWVQTFKKHFLLESVQIEIDSFIHIWYFFFFLHECFSQSFLPQHSQTVRLLRGLSHFKVQ